MKSSDFKISLSVERYQSKIVLAQIEDENEDCVEISRVYLLYFPKNKLSESVTVGPGQSGRAGSSF